jgi:hypothetical protein
MKQRNERYVFFLYGLSLFSFLSFDPMKQQQNYFDFNSRLHWSLSSFFFLFPFPFFLSLNPLSLFFFPVIRPNETTKKLFHYFHWVQ